MDLHALFFKKKSHLTGETSIKSGNEFFKHDIFHFLTHA